MGLLSLRERLVLLCITTELREAGTPTCSIGRGAFVRDGWSHKQKLCPNTMQHVAQQPLLMGACKLAYFVAWLSSSISAFAGHT